MKRIWIISLILGIVSCSIEPQEISYGEDACHFCQMTIVDKQHASQIVTKKGKAFKYDAIECMINTLDEFEDNSIALYLVSNYKEPSALIDATKSSFIISENIPSPMGAFLSAFKNQEVISRVQAEKGGEIYSWSELKDHFKK